MTPSEKPPARVYTIPMGASFVDALAQGLWQHYGEGRSQFSFSDLRILVPTRRAVRSLSEAFRRLALESGQKALLLPSIQPLGDVEEEEFAGDDLSALGLGLGEEESSLPKVMDPLRRQFILSKLIVRWSEAAQLSGKQVGTTNPAQALSLAHELGKFLDSLQTEQVSLDALNDVVPETYTAHWQEVLNFLTIITDNWPKILADEEACDGVVHRNLILQGLAKKWELDPPQTPIIAAGSTGSIPATAELLRVISHLPQGAVILPGLDKHLDEKAWGAVDPVHPQFGMKELIGQLGVSRDQVRDWPYLEELSDEAAQKRQKLINAALRPANATEDWYATARRFQDEQWEEGLKGLSAIEAATPGEEALTIALILRHVLDEPQKTGALVTPDRDLARRVAAHLRFWGIEIDDSAGLPLAQTPVGVFLRLVLEAAHEEAAPVPLLALLKHPLCRLGLSRSDTRKRVFELERICLRGARPAPGISGLRERLSGSVERGDHSLTASLRDELIELIDLLDQCLTPFIDCLNQTTLAVDEAIRCHIRSSELLSNGPEGEEMSSLWSGEAGEACATFLASLLEQSDQLEEMWGGSYAPVFEKLLSIQTIRQRVGQHPRLSIWGPMEARLQSVDTFVLGGLNEGTWPIEGLSDPWLNRPMRKSLGLPPPERRIGLSAHDFAQLSSAQHVYLMRSQRKEGAPTVASRWWLRLETILKGAEAAELLRPAEPYLEIARSLMKAPPYESSLPPEPRPALDQRPRRFSVTEVETWIRDPYAIYAKKILGLRPLEPIDAEASHMERGILIHTILEEFVRQYPDELPEDSVQKLLDLGEVYFAQYQDEPNVRSFWWPRFEHIAHWFIDEEIARRATDRPIALETKGVLTLPAKAGAFTLTGRVDRIDKSDISGVTLYDYKTGQPPSSDQVEALFAPQLPLEALILSEGGFEGVPQQEPEKLTYIQLKGGDEKPGDVRVVAEGLENVRELVSDVREKLQVLIQDYDQETKPYLSRPYVQFDAKGNEYDHLARVKEWSSRSDEGEG